MNGIIIGHGTPVPHRDREIRGTAPGKVKKYRLTPKEWAYYRSLPPPPDAEKRRIQTWGELHASNQHD